MKFSEIRDVLGASVYVEPEEDVDVARGCGCDLMSDVLAFNHEHSVLLTGAVNPQAIRTCEVMEIPCVVFVRDKEPSETVIDLAECAGIGLMGTHYSMFEAVGRLYAAGLRGEVINNDF